MRCVAVKGRNVAGRDGMRESGQNDRQLSLGKPSVLRDFKCLQ